MDDRELEHRLGARLHTRFDDVAAPVTLRAAVRRLLTSDVRPTPRRAAFAAWSGRLLAVAAVVVVAVVVLVLRGGSVPPGGPSPSPSVAPTAPAATASPAPSASETPAPSVGPSTAPSVGPSTVPSSGPPVGWTGLTVGSLTAAPLELGPVIPWSRGYVAIGLADLTGPSRAWISEDGRAWTMLPAATFGLDDPTGNTFVITGTACGDSVLIETTDATGAVTLWSSSDGTTWIPMSDTGVEAGQLTATGSIAIAAGDSGTVAASPGLHVERTTDCATWQRVDLPGPSMGLVADVAGFDGGFVAVGYSSDDQGLAIAPLAWTSTDGRTWTAATVADRPGDGFVRVWAGAQGLIAASTQPGLTPGLASHWTSADGRTWTRSDAGPLGTIAEGEGSGSDAAGYTGDGQRLIAYGTPNGGAGPAEYLTSLDGSHWTTLTLTGDAAASVVADQAEPFLLRDGILFSGASTTSIGDASGG